MNTTLLTILIIIIVCVWFLVKWKPAPQQAVIPAPLTKRTDLYYGYYGCVGDQAMEVQGHTNLHWESQFDGIGRTIDNILTMARTTVLDVGPQLFTKIAEHGKNYAFNPEGVTALRSLFGNLQAHGVLHFVKVLVPMDEPNTSVATPQDLLRAINTIQSVASEFPELEGFKLACIYAAKPWSFTCIERFDYVAVCAPEDGTSLFVDGTYHSLVTAMRPDAKTFILPYGAFGQDPTPFLNFAHSHPEVAAVISFCWFGPREPGDKWVGIKDRTICPLYVEAGLSLTR